MRNLITLAAFAAATAALPGTAAAQQRPVLIVDTSTIMETCTACRAAQAQLRQQVTAAQQFQTSLVQPLEPERKSLETAVAALAGKSPDAALQKRIQAYQQREAGIQQQLEQRSQTLRSTSEHVQQQIGARLITVVEQVRARRGAAAILSKQSTLANDPTAEVTSEVLTALNQQLPSVSVTPLPQQQQQQPPGR